MTLSIVIPSRNEPYLAKTIKDILSKSQAEVIAILDGWSSLDDTSKWFVEDNRVSYIHYSTPRGMRNAINKGVAIAKGDYILKCDAHVMFDKDFDKALIGDTDGYFPPNGVQGPVMKDNWVVIPRRYALDPEKWEIEKRNDTKYPIDYMVLKDFHAEPYYKTNNLMIDDVMSGQGSCWMMKKSYFYELELLDEDTYGSFWNEMQEIGLKCWLSGGEMKVNKNTWYAHWHKTEGRGYNLREDNVKALEALEKWKTKGWHKQTKPLQWLFNKFND